MFETRRALVCVLTLSAFATGCGKLGAKKGEGINRESIASGTNGVSAGPSDPSGATAQKASAGTVAASDIEIIEHATSQPPPGKDASENYWIQYQVWGEMKNQSSRTIRIASANITFYDAAGKLIDIKSIGTAVKQDLHDSSPGETIFSQTHFIPPGGTAPFHYMRNLAAIKGRVASHKIIALPAVAAGAAPVGVASGVTEHVGDMENPALPSGRGVFRMRAFEGTIRNDGQVGCRDPKLVVALLGPDGKMRELNAFDAKVNDNHLFVVAPGTTTTFKGAVHVSYDSAWREKAQTKSWVDCDEPY